MKRKTIMAIVAAAGAVVAAFSAQLGIELNLTAVIPALGVIAAYILLEAKVDAKRIGEQAGKFKDVKFWVAVITTALPGVNEALGLNLPIEAITLILGAIMAFLFKEDLNKKK